MTKMNLVDKTTGVPYQRILHSDGQIDFIIGGVDTTQECTIQSRMNSYQDIYEIKLAANALRSDGVKTINLFVPCFLHQRDDRQFQEGRSFGLWEVCEDIKSIGFNRITLFHLHSDVLPALLKTRTNRVEVVSNKMYIQQAIASTRFAHNLEPGSNDVILVSPDAGAYKWVYKLGEELKMQVVTGNKSRNLVTNELHIDVHGDVKNRVCLICDDLCGGGRSFIELSKELKSQGATHVYLYISHFEGGDNIEETCKRLEENLNGVYTTNSIRDINNELVTQFKVI